MDASITDSGDGLHVLLDMDKFDAKVYPTIRGIIARSSGKSISIIDFKQVTYIDGAGLRLLIMLWRDLGAGNLPYRILLKNCNPQVQDVLAISSVGDLFNVQ